MGWEIEFLEKLGQLGNQNPNMDWLSWIFLIITFTCDVGLIWILAAICMLFFKKARRLGLSLGFGLAIFALLFNDVIIKYSVQRTRPIYESVELFNNVSDWMIAEGESFAGLFEVPGKDSYSFMSGHSFSSFLSATIIFMYSKKAGIGAYVAAILIAFSRLYFGVHFPTDVICGSLFGIVCGLVSYALFEGIAFEVSHTSKRKA